MSIRKFMSMGGRRGHLDEKPGSSGAQLGGNVAGVFARSVLLGHRSPFVFNCLLTLASTLLSVLVIEVGLRALTRDGRLLGTRLVGPQLIDPAGIRADSTRLRALYDPDLGWISRGDDEHGHPSANRPRVRTRGTRTYEPTAPPGVLRVCAFGESFTRGDGVLANESWPSIVEAQTGGRIEVPNFGVGGYGLDQAYLCFRRNAALYHPDVVLVGLTVFAVERTTSLYRPFYSHGNHIALVKPRFTCDAESLRAVIGVVPDPVAFTQELAGFAHHPLRPYESYYDAAIYESSWIDQSRLAWFVRSRLTWHERLARFRVERILGPESEETLLTRLIVLRMKAQTEAMGGRFAAVILPTSRSLRLLRDEHRDTWAPIRNSLDADGVEIWDLQTPFATGECGHCFLPDGHLTLEANAEVAAGVIEHLQARVRR